MKASLQSHGTHRSVWTFIVLASFGVAFSTGCESRGGDAGQKAALTESTAEQGETEKDLVDAAKKPETDQDLVPEVVYEKGPVPTPETILIRGKNLEITLAEYDLAMHRSLLYAPLKDDGSAYVEVPVERTAAPELQSAFIDHLLETRAVREETAKRGIECLDSDVRSLTASRQPLAKYSVLFETGADLEKHSDRMTELAALNMTPDDVRAVACEEVLRDKLQSALLADIKEAEVWAAYQDARNTVDLLLVAINNTPSSAELDAFLQEDAARKEPRIDAHFARYPERYMVPRLALVTILSAPAGQQGPEVLEKLQRAENRLSSGEDPKAIASGLGLVLENDTEMQAGENGKVFAAKVGGTGLVSEGPRGPYVWRLEGFRDAAPLELTRPLRREIAAELLRESGVLESVRKKLQPAIAAMKALGPLKKDALSEEKIEALRAELAIQDLKLVRTTPFVQTQQGFMPGVGLAEEVVDAAFSLSEQKPTFDELVVSRERVYAFRLAARERPTQSQFKVEKDAFRKSYVERRRDQVIPSFTAATYANADVIVDLQPLRIKYGMIAKSK